MDDLNKRVLSVMEAKKLSRTAFASVLEISLPVLTHLSSGRNKPGIDLLQKILLHFKDIDADWLISGSAPMLRKKPESPDISGELQKLDEIQVHLDQINLNAKQVIDYNAILLKEITYLHELNQYMLENNNTVDKLKSDLTGIKEQLRIKLKD